jgi:hypothetical protein
MLFNGVSFDMAGSSNVPTLIMHYINRIEQQVPVVYCRPSAKVSVPTCLQRCACTVWFSMQACWCVAAQLW